MLFDQSCVHRHSGIERVADESHFCDLFDHYAVVDRFAGRFPPCEGAVVGDQHAGRVQRIERAEPFGDDPAGLEFVFPFDLFGSHVPRAGNGTVEIVGMRGSGDRNVAPRLRPCGRIGRVGVGDAAGMFPIDPATGQYDAKMLAAFDRLVADKNYPWTLADLLPEILPVGTPAGTLTPAGAALLDPSGTLQPGAVFCPPEGDAGTGMVATNSVAPGTGNVSAGTSVFAMVVLDRPLARVHREIDMVTTPCGHPVAMVHANNCSSQVNVIAGLLRDFAAAMGQPVPDGKIYDFLFNSAVDGAPDCDGIVTYGYTSGESILNLDAGRPLTVRRADSTVNWPNLMRSNLCGALAALKVGMDILTRDEQVPLQRIYGHGGFFTTPQVGQRLLASALAAPVTVMETAGSGGPWGMALLAAYMLQRQNGERLAAFLERQVFACCQTVTVEPTAQDVADFDAYMQAFHAALDLERRAAEGE